MKYTKDDIRKSMLLYAVTDRRWLKEGESLAEVCARALDKGVNFLQIREKDLEEESFEREARALKALCGAYRVPFVVNDSVELAIAIDADGAHVGQSDIKGRDIRKMLGEDKILGISAGTVEEAQAAERAGADYIGVGAVFSTTTKEKRQPLSVDVLQKIAGSVSIPVVAIGGINLENMDLLKDSGVDGVAVVSAIFAAPDPGRAAEELFEKCTQLFKNT